MHGSVLVRPSCEGRAPGVILNPSVSYQVRVRSCRGSHQYLSSRIQRDLALGCSVLRTDNGTTRTSGHSRQPSSSGSSRSAFVTRTRRQSERGGWLRARSSTGSTKYEVQVQNTITASAVGSLGGDPAVGGGGVGARSSHLWSVSRNNVQCGIFHRPSVEISTVATGSIYSIVGQAEQMPGPNILVTLVRITPP